MRSSCFAREIANCSVSGLSHAAYSGSCAGGYSGICSYTCNDGSLTKNFDICRLGAACPETTKSNCSLYEDYHGETTDGYCDNGYSGTCSYRCNNGSWAKNSNICSLTARDCPETTKSGCYLAALTMLVPITDTVTTVTWAIAIIPVITALGLRTQIDVL